MAISQEEMEEFVKLFPNTLVEEEGGIMYLLLPSFQMPDGCNPSETDILFCPSNNHGYRSRMFFPSQLGHPNARNWTIKGASIFGRSWYSYSWDVQHDLPLVQLFFAHYHSIPS